MTCPAKWARFSPAGRITRLSAPLAFAFATALSLPADELNLPAASAEFSGGTAQLRVLSVAQVPSSQSRRGFAVRLELRLEIPPAAKPDASPNLPVDLFLDNDATPLLAASVTRGRNLAKNAHAWSVEARSGRVIIGDLEVGSARPQLQGVELELVLTKVTQWETLVFQGGVGRSDFFQCGPFELRSSGDPREFRVDAWSYPQFKAQHETYRQRMPVTFLDPAYAMQNLKVFDSANQSPTSTGSSMPSTGAVTNTYSGWRATRPDGATLVSVGTGQVAYPVSMTLRLPSSIDRERVKFRFDSIPLPAPEPRVR